MPIDLQHKLLFIHIPKTGGSSLTTMLGMAHKEKYHSLLPIPKLRPGYKTPQHFTYRELRENIPLAFTQAAFKFAFVRNPWDRFVSEYFWRRNVYFRHVMPSGGHGRCCYGATDLESLESFVRVFDIPERRRIDASLGFDGHLEPQLSYVVDEHGQIVLDFVGRFERFEVDVRRLFGIINWPSCSILHERKSQRSSSYQQYYSNYAQSAVEEFYKDDIDTFEYRF